MPIRYALAALALGCAAAPAAAQQVTAEELIAKNLAARGGAERLAELESVRMSGTVRFPGDIELSYDEIRERGAKADSARVNMTLQGLTLVQAYDGSSAWRINPFEGRRDAERMSDDEARSLADSALLSGPLLSAAKAGSRVAYLGREDFDGTNAYKLKVTQKDGDEFVYLLDPDTMLEIKITETRKLRGAPSVTEVELGDYERVGGVYFPMSIESWSQGSPNQRQRIMIASAEANPFIEPDFFAQPATPAARAGSAPAPAPIDQGEDAAPVPQTVPDLPQQIDPASPPADPARPDDDPNPKSEG